MTDAEFLEGLEDGLAAGLMASLGVFFLILLALVVVSLIATWRIFTKAGYEGWKCLIPFYNSYILCKICFGADNGWYFLFSFIPFVGNLFIYVIEFQLCRVFNKSTLFAILSLFISPINRLIIAFGQAEYSGSKSLM